MANTNVAFFSIATRTEVGQTTAANTTVTGSVDDTLTIVTCASSGSNGAGGRVLHIRGTPTESTGGAGVGYLYLSKDSGSSWRLIDAITVSSDTVSTTDAPTPFSF